MRLFIAINFNEETRSALVALSKALGTQATKGRFTAPQNLHLTLAFLGECNEKELEAAKAAMDGVSFKSFDLRIGQLGRFKRRGGDIWWAGVSENDQLAKVHRDLTDKLRQAGFQLENRPFNPHITLAREVITRTMPHSLEAFGQSIRTMELMKSERIAGRLTYTAIHQISALDCR